MEIPHEPCCLINGTIIVFFFVDDMVFALPKSEKPRLAEIVKGLKKRYHLTGGDSLMVFGNGDRTRSTKWTRLAITSSIYRQNLTTCRDEFSGSTSDGKHGDCAFPRKNRNTGHKKIPTQERIVTVCSHYLTPGHCLCNVQIGKIHDEPRTRTPARGRWGDLLPSTDRWLGIGI